MNGEPFDPVKLKPQDISRRRHRMVTIVLLLAGPAVAAMADLHWRSGFDAWKVLHLALFTVLLVLIALGAAQALVGFAIRRRGEDPWRIIDSLDPADEGREIRTWTAVVMPICNEEVSRVIEGFRTIYESVARTGRLPLCHFFLLSDSSDPNHWVGEEAAWLALTRELGAEGRIFYRKRRQGINKKAGNLADFCRRWGSLYRYMVVLDADSLITGDAIVRLVRLMERNHEVGIIQGVPLLVNGESVIARLQQFASRLYGPLFATGLNYWQLSEANYWGHNAIIRLAPFIRHCSLPELPEAGPFGGRILSHDYVEAALMRRAGWKVWLATDLEGNYEECPATVVDLAQRDRRWLQGNLQHARLVVARGFHAVNRIHFSLGILGYLASPLWLALMAVSAVIAGQVCDPGFRFPPVEGVAAHVPWSYGAEAGCLFAYTTALLLLPKVLALLDLRRRPGGAAPFGGWEKLVSGVVFETAAFTLLAPVLMLFHSWYIAITLTGQKVSWGAQRRGNAPAAEWTEALAAHGAQTVIGILASIICLEISPVFALWMSPVLAGLAFSIPVALFAGSRAAGLALKRRSILLTPEESQPLPELRRLEAALQSRRREPPPAELAGDYGLLQAVLDPYVNAAHVSLLRAKDEQPRASEERFTALRRKLLRMGPEALTKRDRVALLMDVDSMNALHGELWSTPAARLASWWQSALKHYTCLAPPPQTAFTAARGSSDSPFPAVRRAG